VRLAFNSSHLAPVENHGWAVPIGSVGTISCPMSRSNTGAVRERAGARVARPDDCRRALGPEPGECAGRRARRDDPVDRLLGTARWRRERSQRSSAGSDELRSAEPEGRGAAAERVGHASARRSDGLLLVRSRRHDGGAGVTSGIRLLQSYLAAARDGAERAGDIVGRTPTPPDHHRAEVATALRARGWDVAEDVGWSKFRVDLCVGSPRSRAHRRGSRVTASPCCLTALGGRQAQRCSIGICCPARSSRRWDGTTSCGSGCRVGSTTKRK